MRDTSASSPPENQNNPADSELRDYLSTRQLRHLVFPRAALIGVAVGIVALLFRTGLSLLTTLRLNILNWAYQYPAIGCLVPVLIGTAGALLAVQLVQVYAPEASGSGIPHLEAVLHRFRPLHWKRVLSVKFAGGLVAMGSGLVLGREGPTVQMGGAIGDGISHWLKVPERERFTLIAAGAGAGLAAAFNAPLSGLIFVLEEVRRDFQPIVFGAAFVAAVVADIVSRIGSGQMPVFTVPSYPVQSLQALPAFAVVGLLAGVLGVLFNAVLITTLNGFARIPKRYALYVVAAVGALVGLASWFSPDLAGSGHDLAEIAMQGELSFLPIVFFSVLRLGLTAGSYSIGAPGGIFAPLLALGSLIGLAVGLLGQSLMPDVISQPGVFAVVGMAAYFTAIVRAPLTGIVLILEMTGNYHQMLPLLVACFSAYAVAEGLKDMPIYEALMERDLRRGGAPAHLKSAAVLEFIVHPDAPFAGRMIKDLGLPSGCILVHCVDGLTEIVPTAHTRIMPGMKVTAVVAPEAESGLGRLHEGFNSER